MGMAIREVFEIVLDERRYQDALGEERVDGHTHTVGEEVLMLQEYAKRAQEAWVNNPGDDAAMDVVRKIAGIAVRAMENHGAPSRMIP